MVEYLKDWVFSNYLDWIGARQGRLIDSEFIQDYFPENSYNTFVVGYVPSNKLNEELNPYLLD